MQQLSPTCKMPVYQRYGQTGCEILLNCTRIIIVQFDSEPMRLSVTARQAKTALARSPWFTIHSFSFSNHEYYRDQSHTLALQSRVWDCCVTAGYLGLIFKAFWLFRSQKYARTAQITWMCKFLIKLTAHCSLMFCLRLKLPAYFKLGKIRIILRLSDWFSYDPHMQKKYWAG